MLTGLMNIKIKKGLTLTMNEPKIPIVQVDLHHQVDASHSRTMTTWVNRHPALKRGAEIYLVKQPKIKWVVLAIHPGVHDSTEFDWHRKWDNNI